MSKYLWLQYTIEKLETDWRRIPANQTANIAGVDVEIYGAVTVSGGWNIRRLVSASFELPKSAHTNFAMNAKVGETYWSDTPRSVADNATIPYEYAIVKPSIDPVSLSQWAEALFNSAVYVAGTILNAVTDSVLIEKLSSTGLAVFSAYGTYNTVVSNLDKQMTLLNGGMSGQIGPDEMFSQFLKDANQYGIDLAGSGMPYPLHLAMTEIALFKSPAGSAGYAYDSVSGKYKDLSAKAVNALNGFTGSSSNDGFLGGAGSDRANLGDGNDIVEGGYGNDTLQGGAGNDTMDGGPGFDTAVFTGKRSDYTITRSGSKITVSGADGTDTLSGFERLQFDDRIEVGSQASPQTPATALTAASGGTSLSIQQVSMADTVDAARGVLSSKVQVNGQDVTGVPATLKKGWKVGTVADVTGDGAPEIFFFGVDTVNGVGSGYGATWSLNGAGAVTDARVQIQMKRQGWEVAGAANVNGISGDEILWQNTLTGEKAIWTDSNQDGTFDGGFVITGLGSDASERIIGVSDMNKNGQQELLLFNDATNKLNAYEATPVAGGSIAVSLSGTYNTFAEYQSAAAAAGAGYTVFPFVA
ncbi:hypothetical protein [Azospirillum sp.]|uniref:calcium-binding protein n=1 Tax=Azospirillum sp. TaxID=34012 RepID=UPI003D734632